MYPHKAMIQKVTKVSDGGGGYTESWTDFKEVACEVVAVNGREFYQAQQLQNPVSYDIYMDYDKDIQPKMRVIFNELTLSIQSALPTLPDIYGRFHVLNLKCSTL